MLIFGACPSKHTFLSFKSLHNIWTANSPQHAGRRNPHGVQLSLVGVVLTALFSLVSPLWTDIAIPVMILFAGQKSCNGRTGGSTVGGPLGWAQAA
jgi:hypothetical protein